MTIFFDEKSVIVLPWQKFRHSSLRTGSNIGQPSIPEAVLSKAPQGMDSLKRKLLPSQTKGMRQSFQAYISSSLYLDGSNFFSHNLM